MADPLRGQAAAIDTVVFTSGPEAVPLIELYSSEGCSSCPPAERWLGNLTEDKGLWSDFVPVAFHVNYWDRLGWKDVLASPAYTERQYAYAASWKARNVYTPEFIYQGQEWRIGDPRPPVKTVGTLKLTHSKDGECSVQYTPAPTTATSRSSAITPNATGYTVQVAMLGSGIINAVKSGENSGRTLHHEFVAGALLTVPLSESTQASGGIAHVAHLAAPSWPTEKVPSPRRLALIAWVSKTGDLTPIQAAGGWLPK